MGTNSSRQAHEQLMDAIEVMRDFRERCLPPPGSIRDDVHLLHGEDAEELALALRPGSAQEVPKGKSRVERLLETAGSLVGDTGFEPVTSTV